MAVIQNILADAPASASYRINKIYRINDKTRERRRFDEDNNKKKKKKKIAKDNSVHGLFFFSKVMESMVSMNATRMTIIQAGRSIKLWRFYRRALSRPTNTSKSSTSNQHTHTHTYTPSILTRIPQRSSERGWHLCASPSTHTHTPSTSTLRAAMKPISS